MICAGHYSYVPGTGKIKRRNAGIFCNTDSNRGLPGESGITACNRQSEGKNAGLVPDIVAYRKGADGRQKKALGLLSRYEGQI